MFDRKPKKNENQEAAGRRMVVGGVKEPQGDAASSSRASASAAPPRRSAPETTNLGPNITVEGDLKFSGTLMVNCKVKGAITSGDRLVIGATGEVAQIQAEVIEITGKVTGDITAGKSVKILTGGEVDGDIVTPTISMEEGVVFQGRCSRPPEPPKAAAPKAAPKAEVVESEETKQESDGPIASMDEPVSASPSSSS